MTETSNILFCPKLQQQRHHDCCVHCAHSVKLGETWWCAWKEGDAE